MLTFFLLCIYFCTIHTNIQTINYSISLQMHISGKIKNAFIQDSLVRLLLRNKSSDARSLYHVFKPLKDRIKILHFMKHYQSSKINLKIKLKHLIYPTIWTLLFAQYSNILLHTRKADVEIIKRKYVLYINTFLYKIFLGIIYHCQSFLHSNLTCTSYHFLLRTNLASIFWLLLAHQERIYTFIPKSSIFMLFADSWKFGVLEKKKDRIQIKLGNGGV